MQWSKTKSTLEQFLCTKLQGRVHLYATVYRKFHDRPSRVWITFDKKELISASDVTYQTRHEALYQQLKKETHLKGIPFSENWREMYDSPERQQLIQASRKVDALLQNDSLFI